MDRRRGRNGGGFVEVDMMSALSRRKVRPEIRHLSIQEVISSMRDVGSRSVDVWSDSASVRVRYKARSAAIRT